MELRVIKKIVMLYWVISTNSVYCESWDVMERTITGDFHEKKVVTKTILQFAQKISIIKKTIAHKVYKMLLIATLIPDFGSIGEI